jgi:hypothetical protein
MRGRSSVRWSSAVTVDVSRLDRAGRARLAVLTGVAPATVERALKRALPFVVGAYADDAESDSVVARLTARNVPAVRIPTRTPPIVQWAATAMLAGFLAIASSGTIRYGFAAMALILLGLTALRLRRGLAVAATGLAIVERLDAGHSEDVAGEAAGVRSTLSLAQTPDAAQALAALDAAVDELAELAAAEVMNPEGASEPLRAEREARVAEHVLRARAVLDLSAPA